MSLQYCTVFFFYLFPSPMLFWQDEFDREQRFFGTSFAWEGDVDTDGRITHYAVRHNGGLCLSLL